MGRVFRRCPHGPVCPVPPLFETKPVLRAEHAFHLSVNLDLFSDEITSGVGAICAPGHSTISHSSDRNCPGRCSCDLYITASTIRASAALVLARAAGSYCIHDPVVRLCPYWLH